MINILHTIETHGPGGAESVLVNLATSLNSSYKAFGFFIQKGWLVEQFENRKLSFRIFNNKYSIDLPLLFALVSYIKTNKIDIIHAHEFAMGFYSSVASVITGIPCVVTFHGKCEYSLEKKIRYFALKFILRKSIPVAVSYDTKNWIKDNFVNTGSINVIHNGINGKIFFDNIKLNTENRLKICQHLQISKTSILVTTVARLFPIKGVDVLISAAESIVKQSKNVHFLIVGDGPEKFRLLDNVASNNLQKNIHFLGESAIVPQLLSASDIFVLSSHSEGLSISLLEAIASKLPILATAVGDNEYIVKEGVNGFIVHANTPELMAKKILYMINNPRVCGEFSEESLKIFKDNFDNKHMLKAYDELYKETIHQ